MTARARLPVTAMLGSSVFVAGVAFGTIGPYLAIIGIQTLQFSSAQFASIVAGGAVVGTCSALTIGYISDRLRDRRILVLFAALAGAMAYGLIYALHSPLIFVVATCFIAPFGGTIFSQCFSYARVYYTERSPHRAEMMTSVLRAIFSLSWVVVPPLAGWVAATYGIFDLYLISALAYLVFGAIFALMMTDPSTKIAQPAKPAKSSISGERRVLPVPVISGLSGVLLAYVAMRLVALAMPLIIVTNLGGTTADVGIYAGIAAALEVPFMLGWGYASRWVSREAIIVFNSLLFGLYVFLVARAGSLTDVYWLQGLNGIANSALLSVMMSYVQTAIKGRVGLSTSLFDVFSILATMASAALFGIISAGGNYRLAVLAAASIAVTGGLVMLAGNWSQIRYRLPPAAA